MNKLDAFYQLAAKDKGLQEKLQQAEAAIGALPAQEQVSAAREALIKLAGEAGLELRPEDLADGEGAVSDEALAGVNGGGFFDRFCVSPVGAGRPSATDAANSHTFMGLFTRR